METFCWGIIEGIWMFEMLLLLMNGMVLIPIGSLAIDPVWFDCRARDRRFGEGCSGVWQDKSAEKMQTSGLITVGKHWETKWRLN